MSNKQPEALRLADNLETLRMNTATNDQAAAELRRLHTVNQQWKEKAATWLASPEAAARLDGYRDLAQQLNDALMQKDALVEALKVAIERDEAGVTMTSGQMQDARAALAKAQGDGK